MGWFTSKDDGNSKEAYKVSTDSNDGSWRYEREVIDKDKGERYHEIIKGSTEGGIKSIHTSTRPNENSGGRTSGK